VIIEMVVVVAIVVIVATTYAQIVLVMV